MMKDRVIYARRQFKALLPFLSEYLASTVMMLIVLDFDLRHKDNEQEFKDYMELCCQNLLSSVDGNSKLNDDFDTATWLFSIAISAPSKKDGSVGKKVAQHRSS